MHVCNYITSSKKNRVDILIMGCLYIYSSGIHETGTLVGCLRKLEGWNFSSIITEVTGFFLAVALIRDSLSSLD